MAAGETPYFTDDSERESDRLRLLLEVSNAVVSKFSLKDLLVTVSSFLKRFIDHDFASVVLYDEESEKIHVHALDKPAPGGVLGEGTILPMDGTPPGLAIRTRHAGLVIPSDFARRRTNGEIAEIQIVVDGVNSNTAAVAGGYATRIVSSLNQKIAVVNGSLPRRGALSRVVLLYNPGLKNSWFIVTGMIGMLLVMLGIAVSSSAMVKEKRQAQSSSS